MSVLQAWLQNGPLISDGGWGTELQKLGLRIGESADAWNVLYPERVAVVARSYIEAGSNIILTNTFQANAVSLARFGLENRVSEINREGVRISRHAAAGRCRVAASIGPTGSSDNPGALSEQAEALASAGAEALLLESFTELDEARAAIRAVRHTRLPIIMSFALLRVRPPDAARAAVEEGVAAVGVNCIDLRSAGPAVGQLAEASGLPVWAKPNAGLPTMRDGVPVYDESPQSFLSYAPDLLRAGAVILGGCCGTTPDFIRALSSLPELRARA